MDCVCPFTISHIHNMFTPRPLQWHIILLFYGRGFKLCRHYMSLNIFMFIYHTIYSLQAFPSRLHAMEYNLKVIIFYFICK